LEVKGIASVGKFTFEIEPVEHAHSAVNLIIVEWSGGRYKFHE